MNSKKGALFHWIVFGVLAAIGMFVLLTYDAEIGVKVKGEWQLDFLQNYYVSGEEKLLQVDQDALDVGSKTVLALAENGGFAKSSACGQLNGAKVWNTKDTFCFLRMEEQINTAFNDIFIKEYGGDEPYQLSYQGEELSGKTGQSVLIEEGNSWYRVQPDFRVNLGYGFDEYFQLQQEAAVLVNVCKWWENVESCLEKQMPAHWKFSDCDNSVFQESSRKVTFCAESPGKYTIFEKGKAVPVRYTFGLDFVASSVDLPIT